MKKTLLLTAVMLALSFVLMPASGALALEGGGSHYFGGNEDFGSNLPPPGLSVNATVLYFTYDRLKNSEGKTVNVPGGFRVEGVSTSVRLMHVTGVSVLGGNLGWYLTPALVYQHVNSGGRSQTKTEMADLNAGVFLKKDGKTFSHVIGADIFAPTGPSNPNDVCNIGLNYWSFAPTYAFMYLGDKDSPIPGFEVDARFAYYFHTINDTTGYTSGQEFSFDYLVGQRFGKAGQWRIGVNGHFAYQVTDDVYRNQPPDFDGYKARQFTIGPALQYSLSNNALITLKAHFGVYDVNRPEGAYLWLKFWYPF